MWGIEEWGEDVECGNVGIANTGLNGYSGGAIIVAI